MNPNLRPSRTTLSPRLRSQHAQYLSVPKYPLTVACPRRRCPAGLHPAGDGRRARQSIDLFLDEHSLCLDLVAELHVAIAVGEPALEVTVAEDDVTAVTATAPQLGKKLSLALEGSCDGPEVMFADRLETVLCYDKELVQVEHVLRFGLRGVFQVEARAQTDLSVCFC
jgi:hypothetical protein